jgi:membrane protein YqaA with SNARE-associated domain
VKSRAQFAPIEELGPWARAFLSAKGLAIAFFWGLAEGTFFFVIPDVFLSLVAVLDFRRTWKHVVCAVLGATLGGAILFQWGQQNPADAHAAMERVPFVRESMFARVNQGLRSDGLPDLAVGSMSGIPYKLYALEAPRYFSATTFLLATPPARGLRFCIVWYIFGAAAVWLRRFRGLRTASLLKIHAGVWFVVYAVYWGRILSHSRFG